VRHSGGSKLQPSRFQDMEERVRIGSSAAENGLDKAAIHICQLLDCKLPKFIVVTLI